MATPINTNANKINSILIPENDIGSEIFVEKHTAGNIRADIANKIRSLTDFEKLEYLIITLIELDSCLEKYQNNC